MNLAPRALAKSAIVRAHRLRSEWSTWKWRRLPARWRTPHEVVAGFDSWAYLSELTAAVSAVLADHDVEHLVLTDQHLPQPLVVVRRPDATAAARAIRIDARAADWWWAPAHGGLIGRAAPILRRGMNPAGGGIIVRNLVTADGHPLVHSELGVKLEFWAELVELPGGGRPPVGTFGAAEHNGVFDHIGPDLWASAQRNGHALPATPPHLLSVIEPIDLVYTWVDGSDPAWRARKAAALGQAPNPGYSADAAIDARFKNRDELLYSLRSVEMFANWARKIWIVTDRQTPAWLRPDDRLAVVDHRDIFADPSVLPVFNSHAIESQLHHIPGLAERYLYLNDDMLFGSPVRPEDFFHGNGVSKFFTSPALIDVGAQSADDLAVTVAAKNNRDVIEAQFGRTISNKLRHTPQPQQRSLLDQLEADHPEIFDRVMRSRFRHAADYSLPSSLTQYYAFGLRRAVAGRLAYGYIDLASADTEFKLDGWLHRRDLQCFCVNDSGEDSTPDIRMAKAAALRDFFEGYYPLPSRWESTEQTDLTEGSCERASASPTRERERP